jgi:hypothetical protein
VARSVFVMRPKALYNQKTRRMDEDRCQVGMFLEASVSALETINGPSICKDLLHRAHVEVILAKILVHEKRNVAGSFRRA